MNLLEGNLWFPQLFRRGVYVYSSGAKISDTTQKLKSRYAIIVGGNTGILPFHSSVDELAVRLVIYIRSGWQKAISTRVV